MKSSRWVGPGVRRGDDSSVGCSAIQISLSSWRSPGPTRTTNVARMRKAKRVGMGPRLRGDDELLFLLSRRPSFTRRPGEGRGPNSLATSVARNGDSEARADGSPPSRGRRSIFFCVFSPTPFTRRPGEGRGPHALATSVAPKPVHRSARGWVPAFAGTTILFIAPSSQLQHSSPRRRPGPTLACGVCRSNADLAARADGSPPSRGRRSIFWCRLANSIHSSPRRRPGPTRSPRWVAPGFRRGDNFRGGDDCSSGRRIFVGATILRGDDDRTVARGSGCDRQKKWRPRFGRQCPCKGSGRTPSGERPGVQAVGGTSPRVESGHDAARPRLGDWHTLRRAAAGSAPVPIRNLLSTQELAGSS